MSIKRNAREQFGLAIVILSLGLIIGCSEKSEEFVEDKSPPLDLRGKFDLMEIGMSPDEVKKILHEEKVVEEGDSLVVGGPIRLWAHQSPGQFSGAGLIEFDEENRLKKITLHEDYYGVPYQEGFIDTEELFKSSNGQVQE